MGVHLGVRCWWLLHRAEGQGDGAWRDQAWHEDHLLLEGGPVRVPRGAPPQGLGEEALGIHRLPDRALRGEVEGEGGDRLRRGGGGEEGGGRRGRRAED